MSDNESPMEKLLGHPTPLLQELNVVKVANKIPNGTSFFEMFFFIII